MASVDVPSVSWLCPRFTSPLSYIRRYDKPHSKITGSDVVQVIFLLCQYYSLMMLFSTPDPMVISNPVDEETDTVASSGAGPIVSNVPSNRFSLTDLTFTHTAFNLSSRLNPGRGDGDDDGDDHNRRPRIPISSHATEEVSNKNDDDTDEDGEQDEDITSKDLDSASSSSSALIPDPSVPLPPGYSEDKFYWNGTRYVRRRIRPKNVAPSSTVNTRSRRPPRNRDFSSDDAATSSDDVSEVSNPDGQAYYNHDVSRRRRVIDYNDIGGSACKRSSEDIPYEEMLMKKIKRGVWEDSNADIGTVVDDVISLLLETPESFYNEFQAKPELEILDHLMKLLQASGNGTSGNNRDAILAYLQYDPQVIHTKFLSNLISYIPSLTQSNQKQKKRKTKTQAKAKPQTPPSSFSATPYTYSKSDSQSEPQIQVQTQSQPRTKSRTKLQHSVSPSVKPKSSQPTLAQTLSQSPDVHSISLTKPNSESYVKSQPLFSPSNLLQGSHSNQPNSVPSLQTVQSGLLSTLPSQSLFTHLSKSNGLGAQLLNQPNVQGGLSSTQGLGVGVLSGALKNNASLPAQSQTVVVDGVVGSFIPAGHLNPVNTLNMPSNLTIGNLGLSVGNSNVNSNLKSNMFNSLNSTIQTLHPTNSNSGSVNPNHMLNSLYMNTNSNPNVINNVNTNTGINWNGLSKGLYSNSVNTNVGVGGNNIAFNRTPSSINMLNVLNPNLSGALKKDVSLNTNTHTSSPSKPLSSSFTKTNVSSDSSFPTLKNSMSSLKTSPFSNAFIPNTSTLSELNPNSSLTLRSPPASHPSLPVSNRNGYTAPAALFNSPLGLSSAANQGGFSSCTPSALFGLGGNMKIASHAATSNPAGSTSSFSAHPSPNGPHGQYSNSPLLNNVPSSHSI